LPPTKSDPGYFDFTGVPVVVKVNHPEVVVERSRHTVSETVLVAKRQPGVGVIPIA